MEALMKIASSYWSEYNCGSKVLFCSSTWMYDVLVVSVNALLLIAIQVNILLKVSKGVLLVNQLFGLSSCVQLFSMIFNGCLGLVYVYLGSLILIENFRKAEEVFYPLHWWLTVLSQGLTMLVVSLVISMKVRQLGVVFIRIWAGILFLLAGVISFASIVYILDDKKVNLKACLDILSSPGIIMLVLYAFQQTRSPEGSEVMNSTLYEPLNSGSNASNAGDNVTPFATAGFFSKMSFWWLNQLMRKGHESPLEEKDVPEVSTEDSSGRRFSLFLDKLNFRDKSKGGNSALVFWTIFTCHTKDITISGSFALLYVLTLSAGPMLLSTFIKVSAGKEAFKYEGYLLAMCLFLAKCLESLSQRQWYFITKRMGLQLRSLLSAAIYKKQQKLSNTAKISHSSGEIINYLTVDAYRIGEFPFWLHQTWATSLQICIALAILYNAVGLATVSAMAVVILTVLCNTPLAKLQHLFQSKLMESQDKRLKTMSEALVNMKVLKLYAWETYFKSTIEGLREEEYKWLYALQLRKSYNKFIFWASPVLVSAATFLTCYFLGIPLDASNVFTFVATVRLVQDPVRQIPDFIAIVIQANVSFGRIVNFLSADDLQDELIRGRCDSDNERTITIESCSFSWDEDPSRPTLRNINLDVIAGEKVAICGQVGSGKTTLLAAVLGEIPKIEGMIQVCGRVAYVSQVAWIQSGTVQENILFGSAMDKHRYQETIRKCSLVKDLEMLPFGDLTQIGERGINLSGGQKQRVQLARALYKDADIYLLDDPFSAVDAQTATNLFNEYIMGALANKTVLLVTHQVDFLPAFDSILLIADGAILQAASYQELLASRKEFKDLVHAHKDAIRLQGIIFAKETEASKGEIHQHSRSKQQETVSPSGLGQLIKKEEREIGDAGLRPYLLYLHQKKGYLFAFCALFCHLMFLVGQIWQNSWMAANIQNPEVSILELILVYLSIGFGILVFLFFRSIFAVSLGMGSSRSFFAQLLHSLFHAPMSFFDSTPLGRILSRVSSDLSIVDLDFPFSLVFSFTSTMNAYGNIGVLVVLTWQAVFISIPMVFLIIKMQRYYLASAKELMRINGTTKSIVANHLAESISGAMTIRAFEAENRFFSKCLELIDKNASPSFHNFSATEWLIQRLETMGAVILASSAFVMTTIPAGTISSGFVGMALSYGLSLNRMLVNSIQNQCTLANHIISVERLNHYMNIESEKPEVIEDNRTAPDWPSVGKVEFMDLKIKYRVDAPLVLHGITCTFEGGHKIGIVGRTGSGKTTLISALFRLVEPVEGKILVDSLDITTIGLHDLRSRLGIIPQDPTLFHGSVRHNLDPVGQYTDQEIWEVLDKCQLRDAVQEKEQGLGSLVVEDGSNWSMGQRQLFCLGRALLRRSRILVLDEATASVDNSTDAILQKVIRAEFAGCTVITVAHRIPTVMDCNMVLAMSDGKVVEYDEPEKLMKTDGSLFRELSKEYWLRSSDGNIQLM